MSQPQPVTAQISDNQFMIRILIIQVIGIVIGYGVIPQAGLMAGAAGLLGLMILRMTQRRLLDAVQMLMLLHFLQPYLRSETNLPYFFTELCTISFVIFYLKQFTTVSVPEVSTAAILVIVYFFLEVVSMGEYSQWKFYKAIIGNSLALTMLLYAASKRTNVQIPIEKIIRIMLYSGALLSGMILTAHLRGGIEYSTESNFEASNGMAPNQLSFYLAITTFLFFYKFFNEQTTKLKLFYVFEMMMVAGLMALTFSRGGVYFMFAYILFYIFLNKDKLAKGNNLSYLALVFLPLLYYTFTTVINMTDNKLTERFNQEGAGNREDLVAIGFIVFQEHPVLGIGTSGFYKYVEQPRLWGTTSGTHNEFIRSLAEHGMIGGILFFGFVINGFIGVRNRRIPLSEKAVYYIFMFSYVAGAIHNGQKIGLQGFMVFWALSPLTDSRFESTIKRFKPQLGKMLPKSEPKPLLNG